MGAAAVQTDLFADPPPVPVQAPGRDAFVSDQQVTWIKRVTPIWLKRAALLREGRPQPERGAEWRAALLEAVVARLALAAAGGDRLAALRLQLEACQPYEHPTAVGIVCHSGPVMAEIRARLEAAIAEAEAQG